MLNSCFLFRDVSFCPSVSFSPFVSFLLMSGSSLHASFTFISLSVSLHPAATVTSSSENEERCGSSLEWAKDGGAGVRGESGRSCIPITPEESTVSGEAQPRTSSTGGGAPVVTSPVDGPITYHSASLVMPRPNSVAGELLLVASCSIIYFCTSCFVLQGFLQPYSSFHLCWFCSTMLEVVVFYPRDGEIKKAAYSKMMWRDNMSSCCFFFARCKQMWCATH